jgi:hypothetical protein
LLDTEDDEESFKRKSAMVESEVWKGDPENRYRDTVFAPGAAVNKNKAMTPKIQTFKEAEKAKQQGKGKDKKGTNQNIVLIS